MAHLADPVHLTITFTRRPDGAAVRWQAPVLGVRHSRLVSPFRGETLALVVQALDLAQSLRNPHEVFSEYQQALLTALGLWHPSGWIFPHAYQIVGRTLFQALCDDPHGAQALGTVRDYAAAEDRPLALSLRMPPDAVELAALPWELLWDDGPVPLLLSRGRAAACTRYLDLTQAIPAPRPAHQAPLRILALAPQAGIPAQVREEERHARRAAWKPLLDSGQVVMDELSPVTRAALVDAFQTTSPPDVVHYYGHGHYHDGEGALLLDDPLEGECWTSASALMALLGGVRMVTLFACQGAMVSQSSSQSGSLLTGVAPALSAAGIPIVLGMQFTVRVSAATRASGVMYRALAAGWSVQQAASLVRQALYVEENDRASWYVPVLYVRAHDTAPVCLLAPSARHDSHTRPLAAEPPVPAQPAPVAAAPGARQSITAHQNSRVGSVVMHGQAGAGQTIHAAQHSAVERARLRAAAAGQQDIQAAEASEIVDVELDT